MLGVSRITVRHALANLEAAGVLRREHGRGTFVRTPRLVAGTRALTSFSEEMAALGLEISTRVLDVRRVAAGEPVAAALEVPVGTRVVRMRRLRFGGSHPIGVQTAHLRLDRCRRPRRGRPGEGSLYQSLRDRYGIRPARRREVYRVAGVDEPGRRSARRRPGRRRLRRRARHQRRAWAVRVHDSTMRGDRYEIRSSLRAA